MAAIYLHNTLTGKKELFEPLAPGHVSMYHCGPTVYNYLHIGNLRAYVLADTLRRMFEANGYELKQVINITDVGHLTSDNDEGFGDDGEDKVEKMAAKAGKTAAEITAYYTDVFRSDIGEMNIKTEGTLFPKATDHIPEQISLIKELEDKGFAYRISDGIYFDTSRFEGYGKLGNIDIEGLKEGARVEHHGEKRNITDFALWKFSPAGAKRFQEWESPWGVGFPGWHIECSAMSEKYLGKTFDVHTGGIDHIPVHHNNEIAQSEAANGVPLARYWLHGAFVNMQEGKMSKSKDGFVRLKSLEDEGISPIGYRYWLLTARYNSPVQFSIEAVKAADSAYWRLAGMLADLSVDDEIRGVVHMGLLAEALVLINDDLDTPGIIALIWSILKDPSLQPSDKRSTVLAVDSLLGLDLRESSDSLMVPTPSAEIQALLDARAVAREAKDWTSSDSIRDQLQELGYAIRDTPNGQAVRRIMHGA